MEVFSQLSPGQTVSDCNNSKPEAMRQAIKLLKEIILQFDKEIEDLSLSP